MYNGAGVSRRNFTGVKQRLTLLRVIVIEKLESRELNRLGFDVIAV
jgi:hypothetical protein